MNSLEFGLYWAMGKGDVLMVLLRVVDVDAS
jgi:hypothetical protein